MNSMTMTLRVLEPHPGIFAYYDGRVPGKRLHGPERNWLDDGAYSLGVASYAILDGNEALVYDTHISLEHAQAIRTHLEGRGARNIRVVLSHWHKDHVAGNAAFADCQIIALALTAQRLAENREAIETATPPIAPLVMPNQLFEDRLHLTIGRRRVELHHFAIHSADGTVVWLPEEKLLLAGDTLEDSVTYISEAGDVPRHIDELGRMGNWPINRILPAHGDPERIASGGYGPELIGANRTYLQRLLAAFRHGEKVDPSLLAFAEAEFLSGAIVYFEPYEAVHRDNIAALSAALACWS